jgi:uncharacterized membrane protein YkvA (DUF1232 family)
MSEFFSFLKISVLGFCTVLIAFLVLLAWPDSRLRGVFMQVAGWLINGIAALCLIYVISPLDIVPDAIPVAGQIDDLGALVLMVGSLVTGYKSIQAGRKSLQSKSLKETRHELDLSEQLRESGNNH